MANPIENGVKLPASRLLAGLTPAVFMLAGMALVNALSMASSSFLSIYLTHDLGLRADSVGFILSLRGLAAIAGSYVIGSVIDWAGPRKALVGSFIVCAFSYSIIAISHSGFVVTAGLIAIAIARDAFRPVYNVHLVSICNEEDRGRAYSLFIMAMNGGVGIAASIGGWFMDSRPSGMFVWDSVVCLFTAAIACVLIGTAYGNSTMKSEGPAVLPRRAWWNRAFLVVCTIYLLVELAESIALFTLPLYITQGLGLDARVWGYMVLGMSLAVFSLSFIASTYAKRHDQRFVILLSSTAMCVGLASTGFGSSLSGILPGWTLFCLGQVFIYPALMQKVLATVVPETSARAVAFYYSWSSVAALTGPLVAGWLYGHQLTQWVWLLCGLAGLACVLVGLSMFKAPRATGY